MRGLGLWLAPADRARQASREQSGHAFLVMLAAWLVRIEHRLLERRIPADWDAALSLQLDRLTDIRERLRLSISTPERRQLAMTATAA